MNEHTRVTAFPKHFDGKRFFNPDAPQVPGFRDVIRWKLTSRPEPPPSVNGNALRVTLVNHSTVLLQQRGSNILTDPIWSERASPLSWIGPRRRRKPGVSWEDLPPIDLVLISHNHYDHMDLPTLRRLSARGIWDRNLTLWCGYLIESQQRLVYFAGDTAFGPHFSQIREKFGSPHAALLPIGAYEPRWFMASVHMSPAEAVRAHEILAVKTSIAIHHGTFRLADDGLDTPSKELIACQPREGFRVLKNGQFVNLL